MTTDATTGLDALAAVDRDARTTLAAAEDEPTLEAWRTAILGRNGALTGILRGIGALDAEQRKAVGQAANTVKQQLEAALETRQLQLRAAALAGAEPIDVTLPGRPRRIGRLHPVTQTMRQILDILQRLGFAVIEGPEVELDEYNFDRLRIPADHPARDMWDTFWIEEQDGRQGARQTLLRTHTSPMQIRYFEGHEPPIRVAVPGRCYRYEATDATHEWMLQQVELLAIDEGISLADLKGTLHEFARQIFGSDTEVLLRNSYFPFVEPGVELAVKFRGQWLEIMGAGMVHPEIIAAAGYDPERYTGFAAGMGVERIAMPLYQVDDIRNFYQNDLRFLSQF
ncbi:MAG: phenylalanine--tRNA ligase subunit alpha [Chloroflexi bacterium]|nr:phenylalanine--tRNA ligase subunit alpha [Chloroflexota bacterium]